MAEKVLNDPLSGEEIVLAVLDLLGGMLRRDCYLTPNTAYQTFRAHVRVEVTAEDSGRAVEIDREAVVRSAELPPPEAEVMVFDEEIEPAPPNQVRVEAGLPVPVQTKDAQGRFVTKPVKYARGRAKDA